MELPAALRALTTRLDAATALDTAALAAALREVRVTLDDVAPWVRFARDHYVRVSIARTTRWELRLRCWLPGQTSSLHAHEPAASAFRVVRGSATETVLGERDRVHPPGAVVGASSQGPLRQLANWGPDALITLHGYSPPWPLDAPSPVKRRSIAIVGGGFAGAAAAYHLLRRGGPDLQIELVERGPWLGRGVAYGVDSELFRLNVPAAKMSLDPDAPSDFVDWAGAHATPDAFLSRASYGAYVVDRLGAAVRDAPGRLRIVRGDAVAVEPDAIRLADGRRIDAASVVLATGIAPRIAPAWLADDPRIVDAWNECALATLPRAGRILVLGAGLSALDVLSLLAARGFDGRVVVMSRHGLLPRPHLQPLAPALTLSSSQLARAPAPLRGLLAWARAHVREATARGEPWQRAVDALRPHTTRLWAALAPRDRARFARRVRPYWDVLRHRAPRASLDLVDAWRARDALAVVAGTVIGCAPDATGLALTLRLRGGEVRRERFDAVVRCIGPALDGLETRTPLLDSLVASGEAMVDPSGLGLVTDDDGAFVDAAGRSSTRVHGLGALRRASAWETTAVPEIARQAASLARRLLR